MSQKINPIGNKLGILRLWNYKTQLYGRTFNKYVRSIRALNYSLIYLKRHLAETNILVEEVKITKSVHQILIKVYLFDLKKSLVKKESITSLINTLSYWLKNIPFKLTFYQRISIEDSSSLLLINYMRYLLSQKVTTPQKVVQSIYKVINNQKSRIKVVNTNKGLQLAKLIGFKMEFSGCFDSSKTQMAKTLKFNFGSLSLTKLNNYVDYSKTTFFTKFGSCGIKLWLFYDFL